MKKRPCKKKKGKNKLKYNKENVKENK